MSMEKLQKIKTSKSGDPATCLVTGATGYIGGRLVRELLKAGYKVKVLARFPDRLRDMPCINQVEVVAGDALDENSIIQAMNNVDVVYYLLHALNQGPEFVEIETKILTLKK